MRINGFEQIKAFYSWVFENQDKNIKTSHIALYMFLINQNNRNNWVEWFKCPFDLAMSGSGISNKNTYYKNLTDLQDWKLIKYKKGINNYKSPLIKIEVLFDTATVPQSEPQLQPHSIPLPEPLLVPQLTNNIKLVTNNLKPITLNIESVLEFLKNKKKDQPKKIKVAKNVTMTNVEQQALIDRFGEVAAQWMIDKLCNYKISKGKTYKSDYRAILSWVVEEYEKKQNGKNGNSNDEPRINRQTAATIQSNSQGWEVE